MVTNGRTKCYLYLALKYLHKLYIIISMLSVAFVNSLHVSVGSES